MNTDEHLGHRAWPGTRALPQSLAAVSVAALRIPDSVAGRRLGQAHRGEGAASTAVLLGRPVTPPVGGPPSGRLFPSRARAAGGRSNGVRA